MLAFEIRRDSGENLSYRPALSLALRHFLSWITDF